MIRIFMRKRLAKVLAVAASIVFMLMATAPLAHAANQVFCMDGTVVTDVAQCSSHGGQSNGNGAVDLSCSGADSSPCKDRCDAAAAANQDVTWHAASPDGSTPGYCQSLTISNAGGPSCTKDCIRNDVQNFINFAAAGVGIIVVIMIIIGGVQYSTSRDNPQAVQAAKTKIINAVIAMICFIFVYAFLQWIVPGGIF
jgi:hypothetical protein